MKEKTSTVAIVMAFAVLTALVWFSPMIAEATGSKSGSGKDMRVITDRTSLCHNAQLLFNRLDSGLEEDVREGLVRPGSTARVTPTAEIREAWRKDMLAWIKTTTIEKARLDEARTVEKLADNIWLCDQAARGYVVESQQSGRTWQANQYLELFYKHLQAVKEQCPKLLVPGYVNRKVLKPAKELMVRKYVLQREAGRYVRTTNKNKICESAQELLNAVSGPMLKFRGVQWHENSWRNYHNEMAHGQDASARLCRDWSSRWRSSIKGDAESEKLIETLSRSIHRLYNSSYDSAHNAARHDRNGYDKARREFDQANRDIAEACSGLSVPAMLASYPATTPMPQVREPAPPPPPGSGPCEWPCHWDAAVGLCECDPLPGAGN